MNNGVQTELWATELSPSPEFPGELASAHFVAGAELAGYLPHLGRMSKQLKATSQQIESSVVGVCDSFQGIAERAKETVSRTAGFLSSEGHDRSSRLSFEKLIENC